MAYHDRDKDKLNSWYTESSNYNADDGFENTPFATDPRTFPTRASTATSMSYSHPFAMIPLPSPYQLHTIEEMRNEAVEPSQPATRRFAESLAVKNGELVEKSLKSISLIRSRLLQQQEANRKKNCEFQQIRASLDIVRSLVHLVSDETSNKKFVEFSTEDFKIAPHARTFKLMKVEKDNIDDLHSDSANTSEKFEHNPLLGSVGSGNVLARSHHLNLDSTARPFKAMTQTSTVPTTPTNVTRPLQADKRNLHKNQLEDGISNRSKLSY